MKNSTFDLSIKNMIREKWAPNRKLVVATFEISPRCNFSCIHCYLGKHRIDDELNLDQIKFILDQLYDAGVFLLTLTGGEILLRKDFSDIYMYAKKLGMLLTLYTNGSLISSSIIELFKKYPPLLIDISIYGGSNKTYYELTMRKGMFDKVYQNLLLLKKANQNVALKMPIMKCNLKDVSICKTLAQELGFPFRFSFELDPTIDCESTANLMLSVDEILQVELDLNDIGSYEKEVHYIESILNNVRQSNQSIPAHLCSIGEYHCFVDYRGNMAPCVSYRHKSISLFANSIKSIWEEFAKYKMIYAKFDYKCVNCSYYIFCKSCPGVRDMLYGDCQIVPQRECIYASRRFELFKKSLKGGG